MDFSTPSKALRSLVRRLEGQDSQTELALVARLESAFVEDGETATLRR
jgi:hypothetical protein